MKIVIASDIHGSEKYCKQLTAAFRREGADKLALLGDILYHGPRNPLPEAYAPQSVLAELTAFKDRIICVRGNCDAEIDVALLPFPVSDYASVTTDGVNIYFSHGHRAVPPLGENDVYVTGHTHVPLNSGDEVFRHLNPGSVSLPKEDSRRGYILFDGGKFLFKSLDGEVYDVYAPRKRADVPAANGTVIRRPSAPLRRKLVKKRK